MSSDQHDLWYNVCIIFFVPLDFSSMPHPFSSSHLRLPFTSLIWFLVFAQRAASPLQGRRYTQTIISTTTSASTSVVRFMQMGRLSRCEWQLNFVFISSSVNLYLKNHWRYDCNGTPAQRWLINRGSTKVQLAGMNFCLDAGSSASSHSRLLNFRFSLSDSDFPFEIELLIGPANGVALKIWQCYDNLPAQQWYFTDDSRIALEGRGMHALFIDIFDELRMANPMISSHPSLHFLWLPSESVRNVADNLLITGLCVDLPNGDLTNANQVQTWQCTDGNVNQIWTLWGVQVWKRPTGCFSPTVSNWKMDSNSD